MFHHLVDLYHVCPNYATWAKNGPPRGHMFHTGLYRVNLKKIFSSETARPIEPWYLVCSITLDLYQVCINYAPWAKNGPTRGGHMFYLSLYRENMNKSSCLKPQGLESWYWYVASPSGPLPSLLKLCRWGQKLAHPRGHMFYIGFNTGKTCKTFLSETRRPWYLVCSIT